MVEELLSFMEKYRKIDVNGLSFSLINDRGN
jgi:hypothetical protein